MEFRHLGRSGLMVSEISYGNWLTHGSQVEADQATACVREALECGTPPFGSLTLTRHSQRSSVVTCFDEIANALSGNPSVPRRFLCL